MSLRQFACFVAVVDEGSFTRGARLLGITQPSLSHHVRALEEDIGGPLLERVSWEEFVVVAPPGDPLAARRRVRLEELADREWVLYHADHGLAGILEEVCRRAGFSPRGTVRTSQAEGAARLASAGIGPALVPDNIVLPGIEGSVLRLDPPMIREVAVYARTELSRTAAAFVAVLR